jgi:hypothetical protein
VKYAHLFWKLFGIPPTGWDDLPYDDFRWMRAVADDYAKREEAAARG